MPDGAAVTFIVGKVFTVIEAVAVLVQVFALVAVTVYTSVPDAVGVAVTGLLVVPDNPPPVGGVQIYVVAPVAVMVLLAPIHIVAGLGVTVNVGFGFTVKLTVFVLEQPLEVPVTV